MNIRKLIMKLSGLPFRELSTLSSQLIAFALACIFIAYMFPLSFLSGNSIIFDPNYSDNGLHMASWWFYAHDSWHFPLLLTERINFPDGQNIAFTDSIPIAALFFKTLMTIFPTLLPKHFHYFGWWVALVFILQAVSATLLSRALGVTKLFPTIAIVFFALTWPPIHIRYPHTALMMQCIIIFSLAFYFLGKNKLWSSDKVIYCFILINIVALTVHPYFLPISFSLFCAFLIDQKLHTKNIRWLEQGIWLLFLLAILICVGFLFGYFQPNTIGGGYGDHYSFDLLSPFCGNTRWSQCNFVKGDITARQFEGFNYFGIGLIFLIPCVLFLKWRAIPKFINQYPALILVIFGIFLFSVTNHIRLGDVELFTFPIPSWLLWITGTFRAAGRFFWIVGYLILFLTLTTLLKRNTAPIVILVFIALMLQLADEAPSLKKIRKELAKLSTYSYVEWASLMKEVDQVNIYPVLGCTSDKFNQVNAWAIYQVAGYYEKRINTAYSARTNINCHLSEELLQDELMPRQLYLIGHLADPFSAIASNNQFPAPFQNAMKRGECVTRTDGMLCLLGSTPEFWQDQPLKTYPVKLIAKGRYWLAGELSTNIGQISGRGFAQRLMPKIASVPGWLSFGPSIPLPLGKYKYTIVYRSPEKIDKTVGKWDVALKQGGDENEKFLYSGKLTGTAGVNKQIEGVLTIAPGQETMPFEIRTFYMAQGDLELIGTTLQKIP
jgi:hypothetical protein